MDLKDIKKLFKCDEDTITTPISFMLNGKCTNANLITKLVNFCVKKQMVLFKGKRMNLSQIGAFKDGYCTCCEEVIVTPGGSSNLNGSGSGGAGIGGGLVEAWANAKLFNTSSNNQFFCGGSIGNVKIVNYNNNLYFQATAVGYTAIGATNVTIYNSSNIQIGQQTGGLTASFGNIPQNDVAKIVITVGTYSSGSNPMCTNGGQTFTP